MDMDILTAVILTACGLVLLWILIIRKRYATDVRLSQGIAPIETATGRAGSDGLQYTYGASWTTGRRAYMEDRHVALGVDLTVGPSHAPRQKRASLYGVFDGHGGARAADFCRDNMLAVFRQANQEPATTVNDGDGEGAELLAHSGSDSEVATATLHRAMCLLDTEFLKVARSRNFPDGTTAVVALTHGDQLVVGNIGDSRAVLVTTTDDVVALSVDHKPDRADERKRVEDLGGFVAMKGVFRVMGILAVSRAVGDIHLKKWVPGVPEMMEERSLRRARAKYLVIASDGLWDVMRNDEIPRILSMVGRDSGGGLNTAQMARVLTEEASRRQSMDNITVVVVDLTRE